jgi:hypothetical protein
VRTHLRDATFVVVTLGLVLVTATFCGGSTTGGAQPDASSATSDARFAQ